MELTARQLPAETFRAVEMSALLQWKWEMQPSASQAAAGESRTMEQHPLGTPKKNNISSYVQGNAWRGCPGSPHSPRLCYQVPLLPNSALTHCLVKLHLVIPCTRAGAISHAWPGQSQHHRSQVLPFNCCAIMTLSIWHKAISSFPSLATNKGLSSGHRTSQLLIDGTKPSSMEGSNKQTKNNFHFFCTMIPIIPHSASFAWPQHSPVCLPELQAI